jgi:hypothetical protein
MTNFFLLQLEVYIHYDTQDVGTDILPSIRVNVPVRLLNFHHRNTYHYVVSLHVGLQLNTA